MATIGDTNAPSTNTVYYDALLTTTLDNYRAQMVDNIYKDSAFLAALREFGGIRKDSGGERIREALMYETNTTVGSYEGYEQIDTTPQDGMTAAFYEWRELAATISISRREQRQNSSEAAIMSLLEAKTKQAEMGLREEANTQLLRGTVSSATFVPGNGGKDMNPLGWFLRKDNEVDPTTGGDVGNIAGDTETWWRHKTAVADSTTADTGNSFALAISTYAGMKVGLRRMKNYCARGSGGAPNLLVGDQVSFETYENALDTNVRFQNTRMADLGFDSVKVAGAEFIWDEIVPDIDNGTAAVTAGTVFFLNTNFYKLVIDGETDFVTTPFITPENQTAMTAKVLLMANACVSNLRKHGVLYGLSQTITS
jgi:hypothetical protein